MDFHALTFLEKVTFNFDTDKINIIRRLLFCSSHFSFLVFGNFWRQSYKNMKILCNLCLHFARQDGQDGKNQKKITQLKWPKYQKTKIWDEWNKCLQTQEIKIEVFRELYYLVFNDQYFKALNQIYLMLGFWKRRFGF